MSKKFVPSIFVAALLLSAPGSRAVPFQQPAAKSEPGAAGRERVRAAVVKVGSGLKARVKVTLRDGTKMSGFISRIGEDDFELVSTDDGSVGVAHMLRYEEVRKLKGRDVSIDWLRVASTTAEGARLFLIVLRGVNLRLPPQP